MNFAKLSLLCTAQAWLTEDVDKNDPDEEELAAQLTGREYSKRRKSTASGQQSTLHQHFNSKKLTTADATRFNSHLLRMLVMCGVSFRIVNNPWFRAFVQVLHSSYVVPGA